MKEQFDVVSIGQAAAQLQQTTKMIGEAAGLLGIKPKATIDGVPHFAADDVTRIALQLKRSQRELDKERAESRFGRIYGR